MESMIEIKNLGKKYNINHQQGRYLALRDVMAGIFKNPFKFFKDKAKQVAGIETTEEYWALKDVNFTVNKGEVIGVIGRNGAGKSTLLKILSQITPPTTGEIKIRGRVGSLLEVGTGFHPELTGRENIMLNGAILGMTHREIARKFDQIVEFAGIDKFLDTPVKYYSSGMYVRLAFSVAAHMEPDILIIDEVLAVGDAEFQKKCLGKMDEISRTEGRTIIFVSHNMAAIQQLCQRGILLNSGKVQKVGNIEEVIDFYQKQTDEALDNREVFPIHSFNGTVDVLNFNWLDENGNRKSVYNSGGMLQWETKIKISTLPKNFNIVIALENESGQRAVAFTSHPSIQAEDLKVNETLELRGSFSGLDLSPGRYSCAFGIRFDHETVTYVPRLNSIEIQDSRNFENQNGIIRTNSQWELK